MAAGVTLDPFRQAIASLETNKLERQILWPNRPLDEEDDDPDNPKPPKPKPIPYDWSGWGNRVSVDAIAATAGQIQNMLDLPELPTPQAIGVNLFRSDLQADLNNSDVFARVTYACGRSGKLTFDCDWRGGFVLHCTKLTLDFVSYRVNPAAAYVQSTGVILAATAGLNGVHPSTDPTLTYLPEEVLADGVRAIEIPVAARRVSLLMKYSSDPGDPGVTGDAPLGSTFLSFADPDGNAMSWIDALNTRSVVFGAGLAIPHGARYLGLSNNDAATTYLGAVFHLGF
jgi:hypothetical protein